MRFVLAAVLMGVIGFWASEVLFWTVPRADFALADQALTCLAYVCCAALAFFVIARAGVQGVRGAFLGGAILGYLVEGAVVGTMYDAFPFQLVWTPLAWHGLISGGVVLGLGRLAGHLAPWRMAALWLALGLFGTVMALYWPMEVPIPGQGAVLAYLLGFGLLVVLAQIGLDQVGEIDQVPRWAVLVPGLVLGLSWVVQGALDLNPLRLTLPLILAALAWVALRLGDRRPLRLGPKGGWRHGLFLLAPLTVALAGRIAWNNVPQGAEIWPMALVTSAAGLLWLALMTGQALSGRR